MPSVTIIGAGPAGSIAAILLARAGWNVALLEQHRFPRDKVCGECLSRLGIEVLERLNLTARISDPRPIELGRTLFYPASGPIVEVSLPKPMWGISRSQLDAALLNAAAGAGATLLHPARAESVRSDGNIVVGFRDLTDNRIHERRSDFCIVADGKAALGRHRPQPTVDFGIKAHFQNARVPDDAIVLFGVEGSYGGAAPVENGSVNFAFSVPARRLREVRGDLDALLMQLSEENARLRRAVERARRVTPWLAAPLPRFAIRETWSSGIVPIGNAACAIEPIGGEGIGLAIRSAELAANALVRSDGRVLDFDAGALAKEYRSLWTPRRLACRAVAQVLARPAWSRIAAEIAPHTGGLTAAVMGWIGKGG